MQFLVLAFQVAGLNGLDILIASVEIRNINCSRTQDSSEDLVWNSLDFPIGLMT
jgi:hypothetical protein